MKRVVLVLAGVLLVHALAFTQRGRATQEMYDEGLCAAHDSFPLDSTVEVYNNDNGKSIEVTITERIRASGSRVIDLSYDAWEELEMTPDSIVELTLINSAPVVTQVVPAAPTAAQAVPTAPTVVQAAPSAPPVWDDWDDWDDFDDDDAYYNDYDYTSPTPAESDMFTFTFDLDKEGEEVTVTTNESAKVFPLPPTTVHSDYTLPSTIVYHLLVVDRKQSALFADIGILGAINVLYKFNHGSDGYIVALYTCSTDTPISMPEKSRILVDMVSARTSTIKDYIDTQAFRRLIVNPVVIASLHDALAIENAPPPPPNLPGLKLTPATLPDPNNGKIYRMQVGAFSVPVSADRIVQQLKNAGFEAAQEVHGSLYRVMAVNVRSANLSSAVQQLYTAGFKDIWIRE